MLYTFKAIPIIARGNPYVSIKADHSDPGRIVKYAPKPYLKEECVPNGEKQVQGSPEKLL